MGVLRQDLLDGLTIVHVGDVNDPIGRRLAVLGAHLAPLDPGLDDDGLQAWAGTQAPVHGLLIDARPLLARGLQEALTQVWTWIHAVANGALIAAPSPSKIVLLAPAPTSARHAGAARGALENLARTLSVEWARYRITSVALMPLADTPEDQLAELVAFLVSRAGDYFTGCRLELGGLPAWRDPS